MTAMTRPVVSGAATSAIVVAAVCLLIVPASAQRGRGQQVQGQQGQQAPQAEAANPPVKIAGDCDKVRILPPGGPAPRTADGHVDLSGRWYPNYAGRMLQGAYRIDPSIMRQFDPAKTPQENPVFRPETADKYQHPTPYGT